MTAKIVKDWMRDATELLLDGIETEFRDGDHQRRIQDLPWIIQHLLGCSWGDAMSHANDIRVKLYPIGAPK